MRERERERNSNKKKTIDNLRNQLLLSLSVVLQFKHSPVVAAAADDEASEARGSADLT